MTKRGSEASVVTDEMRTACLLVDLSTIDATEKLECIIEKHLQNGRNDEAGTAH